MILFQFHPYHNKTSLISIPIPETGHSFTHHPTNPSPTPSSEPETWILIDDS